MVCIIYVMYLVKFFLYCALFNLSFGDEEVLLDIPLGTLKGLKKITAFHGMPMYTFQGIPYVKPNIGINKFRPPEQVEAWTGVKDATMCRDNCVGYSAITKNITGNEDCLYLNVYTPDLNRQAKRAVIFVIESVGFNSGTSHDESYGGDFLVERDVIVVTMNYRVGIVGFLNLNDPLVPGNAGLKDQVMALRWVQDNIEYFSGSPKRVTILGISSGSASVQYHMLSPMSQGLFSGVIIHSGSIFISTAWTYTPRDDAMVLIDKLGIKATSTAELVQQLSQVSTEEMVRVSIEMTRTLNSLTGDFYWFKPSVETDFGQDRFLVGNPWELIKSEYLVDVPVLTGQTNDESGLWPMVINNGDNFDAYIPANANVTDPEQRKSIADAMKEFYFHGKSINMDTIEELVELLTDSVFTSSCTFFSTIINSRNTSPVYRYLFNFNSPMGFIKESRNLGNISRVVHGDDLGYLFYGKHYNNKPTPGSDVEQKTNEMVEMWTNFAKEGNPSATMDVANVKWEPIGDDDNYLEIGNDLIMKNFYFKERVNLWAQFYKNVLGDYVKLFN